MHPIYLGTSIRIRYGGSNGFHASACKYIFSQESATNGGENDIVIIAMQMVSRPHVTTRQPIQHMISNLGMTSTTMGQHLDQLQPSPSIPHPYPTIIGHSDPSTHPYRYTTSHQIPQPVPTSLTLQLHPHPQI